MTQVPVIPQANTPSSTVKMVPMKEIFADESFNCRGNISPTDVVDLVKDIELQGLIQPVTLAPYNKDGYKWKLLAGFRRHMAHRVMQRTEILAVCRHTEMQEIDARFLNLTENLRRKDLTIMQEARALIGLFTRGVSETEAARRLGQSRGWVQERFMLLKLPETVQKEVEANMIPKREIRTLYTVYTKGDPELLNIAVRKIKDAKIRGGDSAVARMVLPKYTKQTKRRWQPNEIFKVMNHIQQYLGNGLHTRCLAWAAGEISTQELFETISKECELSSIAYKIPTEGEWNAD
jgi:ParB/RepB/Spo0J family partition protein